MESNIKLENFRIKVVSYAKLTEKEISMLIMTVLRGTYARESVERLMNLASALNQRFEHGDTINDNFREEVKTLVDRFNAVPVKELNQRLLQNAGLPMGSTSSGATSTPPSGAMPVPPPVATPTTPSSPATPTSPPEGATGDPVTMEAITLVINNVFNPITLILPKDDNNALVPVARQSDIEGLAGRVTALEESGGNGSFPFNAKIAGLTGAIAFVVLLLIFWLLVGMTFSTGLYVSAPAALLIAVLTGWFTTDRNHN